MNTLDGNWELPISPLSSMRCFYMQPSKGRRRQRGSSADQGSISRPDLEADQSAMELVGYWTSHKEIWDIYHSVYLLRRSPGLPPCGSQWRREAIHDILSSLRSWLHQQVYPTAAKETQGPVEKHQSRLRRRGDLHEEALQEARVACQRALEAAQVLKSDIWKDWPGGWEMHHEPTPIAVVGVTCKVVLWTDDQGPLVGLNKRGGWPSRNWRLNQTPKRVGKVTPQSPPS